MPNTLRHECSPVNLLHIFKTPFYKNTSGGLLLILVIANYYFVKNEIAKNIQNCFIKNQDQGRIQDEAKEAIASFETRNIGFKEYRS